MHHVITHIHKAVENRKLHLSFLDIEGASDSTSHYIKKGYKMACTWRHTLVMDWLHAGWQKNYSHTHRRNTGRVCGKVQSAEGHFITP